MAFPQCRGEGESEEGKVVSFLFGTVVDESSRLVALLSRRRRGSASLLVFCVFLVCLGFCIFNWTPSLVSVPCIRYRLLCAISRQGNNMTNGHQGLRPRVSMSVFGLCLVYLILIPKCLPSISFSSNPGCLRCFLSSFACWLPGLVESRTCWSIRCLGVCPRRMFLRGA